MTNMTVVEAYSVFKKEYSDLVILSCYEYDSCFTFHAVPKEYDGKNTKNMVFDSVFSVSKEDGSLSFFNPLDIPEDEYERGEKMPVNVFEIKINAIPKYDRDAVIELVNKNKITMMRLVEGE